MAIRYSGDIEIRMVWRPKSGSYRVSFRAPEHHGSGTLSPRECGLSQKEARNSPEAYDKVAHRVLGFLKLKGVRVGALRRVYQAPCPIPIG